MIRYKFILLFSAALLLSCYPLTGYAQKIKEAELEGSMLTTDLDIGISFNLALKYNYWINQYIGCSLGGQGSHSQISQSFDSPSDRYSTYYLDGQIFEFNGIIGLKLTSPTYKRMGVMADFNFLFDPIPFNVVFVDKKILEPHYDYPDEKNKNKLVYTHFNPSYTLQVSLFYELKKDTGKTRLAIGCGISSHNPYNAYYHTKIDKIPLRDQLKLRPDKLGFLLFVRLSGY